MNARVKILFEEAGKLTANERQALARLLLESLAAQSPVDAAWGAEAERRWNEHAANGEPALDALEAVEKVRDQLNRRRNR